MSEWSLLGGCFLLMNLALVILLYPMRQLKWVMLGLGPLLAGIIVLGYWGWGAWSESMHYERQQAKVQKAKTLLASMGSPQALMAKLKAHLEAEPGSSRGWYLLGKLYASQGLWQAAHDAYAKAHQLKPNDVKTTVNLAHSLWQLNHMQFNDEIRALYRSLLQQNASQPDALAMLAMDAFVRHAYQDAIDHWQQLLKIVPPQSEEAQSIHKAIIHAQEKITSSSK